MIPHGHKLPDDSTASGKVPPAALDLIDISPRCTPQDILTGGPSVGLRSLSDNVTVNREPEISSRSRTLILAAGFYLLLEPQPQRACLPSPATFHI